jgi:hypothetical protein
VLQTIKRASCTKSKVSPVHNTKENGGSTVIAQLILNFEATPKLSASLHIRDALLPNKRLGEPQNRSGCNGGEKISFSCRDSNPSTSSPQPSECDDYGMPAPINGPTEPS